MNALRSGYLRLILFSRQARSFEILKLKQSEKTLMKLEVVKLEDY